MPARKPKSLNRRHSTKAEKAERESAELAMTPTTKLSESPPAILARHKKAMQTWKRLVGLYFEAEGEIVTAFDEDALAKYCLLEEECLVLEDLRDGVLGDYEGIHKQLARMKPKGEEMKIYYSLLEQVNALLARYQGLDARLDGKRKHVHTLAQSLYLTPRSRAGVAPTEKAKPEAPDETESVLNRSGEEGKK